MYVRRIALVVAALAAACTHRYPELKLGPAEPLRYRSWAGVLPTGARLAVYQFAGATRVTLTASFLAGTNDDPPGKEGTAWLAVALAGHAVGPGGFSAEERVFASGAFSHADLNADDLEIRTVAKASQLDALIALEGARLADPLAGVTEADFAARRDTLVALLEQGLADPEGLAAQRDEVLRRVLAGTPRDRPAPTPASLRAITFEDVRAWARRAYSAERASYVLTGPGDVVPLVPRFQLALPRGPKASPAPPPALATPGALAPASRELTVRSTTTARRRLWLAWPVPGDSAGQLAAVEHLALKVARRLRHRATQKDLERQVEEADAWSTRAWSASAVLARIDLAPEADAEVVRKALAAAAGTALRWASPVPSQVIDRRFGQEFVRVVDVEGIPDGARLLRLQPDDEPMAARQRQAVQLRREEGAAFEAQHLVAERAVSVLFEPEGKPAPEPPEEVGEWRSTRDALATASPGADEIRGLVEGPRLASAARRVLPNGLEVVVLPGGAMPLVDVRLVVRADVSNEAGAALTPFLGMLFTRKEWTFAERYTCQASVPTPVGETVRVHEVVASAHLELALSRIACWTRQVPDSEWFEEYKEVLRNELRTAEQDAVRRANALATQALYGRAHRVPPSPAVLGRLEFGDAERWFEGQFVPDRALLLVAGRIDPEVVFRAAETWLGPWGRKGVPPALQQRPAPERRLVLVSDLPGSDLALVRLALRLPPRAAARPAAERTLAAALELALERTASPSERSSAWIGGLPDEPILEAVVYAPAERAAAAARGALDALDTLARKPLEPAELGLVRWTAARSEAYRYDHPSGAAAAAELLFVQGLPLSAWDSLPEALATVDAAAVQEVARAGVGREVVVVIGDAKRLAPALRTAGLEPEVVGPPPERRR